MFFDVIRRNRSDFCFCLMVAAFNNAVRVQQPPALVLSIVKEKKHLHACWLFHCVKHLMFSADTSARVRNKKPLTLAALEICSLS